MLMIKIISSLVDRQKKNKQISFEMAKISIKLKPESLNVVVKMAILRSTAKGNEFLI